MTSKAIMGASTIHAITRWLVIVAIMSACDQAIALPTKIANAPYLSEEHLFPKPAAVRKQVTFWEVIFSVYPSTTVLIHDSHDQSKIIDILDHTSLHGGKKATRQQRDRLTRSYLSRYRQALLNLQRLGKKALSIGTLERRLYATYGTTRADLQRLFEGKVKIRGQSGLADEFVAAANRAQSYLPEMERIFASYGLPTKLTRIVFVESMFRSDAISKVGASGMWQFMRQTADKYIYVNDLVDERNSPFKATRAAAQLLSHNFRELRSWPLAVTAYNHGREGMKRARQQLRTTDFGVIIDRYESKTFGFASRNFYGELLAASNVYENLRAKIALEAPQDTLRAKSLILTKPVSVAQLLAKTSLDELTLKRFNLCIRDKTFKKHRELALPDFFEIFVPEHLLPTLASEVRQIEAKRLARR